MSGPAKVIHHTIKKFLRFLCYTQKPMKSSKKPKKYENLLYLRNIGKNRHLQSISGKIRAISPLYFIFNIKMLHLFR